jgi:phosphatidylinositol 4-kinase B
MARFLDLAYDTDDGATEDSTLPCFAASGDQTAAQLRERFQQGLTHSLVVEHVDRLIDTSLGSTWTRLYDSVSPVPPSIHLVWN